MMNFRERSCAARARNVPWNASISRKGLKNAQRLGSDKINGSLRTFFQTKLFDAEAEENGEGK